ncbi:MAG: hypothetical protein SF097_15855, partial [Acidobacteriota bacterium]|nr:hypothetical protein [Acidobacteriota bacterium]
SLLTSMKINTAIYCHWCLLSTVRFFVTASVILAALRRHCFHYISGEGFAKQVFAPEAQRKLAGGEGFAKPPETTATGRQALKGRQTHTWSDALSGLEIQFDAIPVVTLRSPPANFRRPFRTKRVSRTCAETNVSELDCLAGAGGFVNC